MSDLRGPRVTIRSSWYGEQHRGRLTASGEKFNPDGFTCTCWDHDLGSILEVEHQGKRLFLRVNDRGPAPWTKRTLDITERAAKYLGFHEAGEADVIVRKL